MNGKIHDSGYDSVYVESELVVVFTNGCFDILHEGHRHCLKESKMLGDLLIVGLNSDDSVRRLKGPNRPVNTWQERSQALALLSFVDHVVKFEEDTPIDLIRSLRPKVITKGGDYKIDEMIGKDFVESYGGSAVIIPYLKGHSTTSIIDN